MTCGPLTASQVQLLKARATRYSQYKQQKPLSAEHGTLAKEIDQYLVYGLLKHGYDESLPGELSESVFVPFNKCLTICMENGIVQNKEGCEICDSISDLTKHSSVCMGHPEACPTCKSFFNLLEYHLLSCHTCDMHLCTKLKLKLMKYHSTVEGGLVDLWPKIQQYISRLCPAVVPEVDVTSAYQRNRVDKLGAARYPSVFDSGPLTPCSPKSLSLVARGIEHEQVAQGAHNMGADTELGRVLDEHEMDMDVFTSKFGDTMGMQSRLSAGSLYGPVAASSTLFDPMAASNDVFMSTDLSSFGSLNLNSIDSKLKLTDGYGSVIMGEPRQLRQVAEYWQTLKKRLAASSSNNSSRSFRTEVDGVILRGVNSGMHTVGGQYKKNEQWRKITYVGSGVAGKCYLAVDINTESQFAVKKIDLLKYQPEELELWSELEHPNLVQLFGAIRVKNKVYIFSEFYAAGNLAEFIEGQQMLDQWLSLYFLSQLLHTLVYLSKRNILHEDIKADNIFLKPDSYKVGLGDFGLSRKGRCPPNEKPVGGQHHWSPEKAMSEGHGFPADVWALNCTFVHMLCGEPPWKRRFSSILMLHYKIGKESPPVEDIPENLLTIVDTLIRKAWTVDPSERPTATELMQEECFEIIHSGYDRTDPVFRSHFPEVEDDEGDDMDFDSYEPESNLSFDSLLDGMENKEQAAAYLNHIYATLGDEDAEVPVLPAATSSSTPLRRQFSVKPPPLESIVEELDISVDPTEDDSLHLSQKNILERREMPAISPLVLPNRSSSPAMEKRNSWGRSNTSPSPSTEQALQNKRNTLRKQETSPAIVLSTTSSNEELVGLVGEKNIFDLNPNTSGYQTGSTSMYSGDAGLSLTFHSDGPVSNLADFSSSWSQQWLGTPSSSVWPADHQPTSANSHANGNMTDNMMGLIPLKPESSAMCAPLPDKFDLTSSLKILKDSLSTSSIEPKCILTIVNGITKIDQTEVLIRGNETWRDIIEQNMAKINGWNMDGYTYYVTTNTEDVGFEVQLNELVPRDKTNVYIYPTQEQSTWQVKNSKIGHVH